MKKTKIIATIGPSCDEYFIIKNMINVGLNCIRINMSHATYEECDERINNIRKINDEGNNIGILIDTKGPEIRTGCFENKEIQLTSGNYIYINDKDTIGNEKEFSIHYKNLLKDVNVGNNILLSNGLIKLTVVEKLNDKLKCLIENSGKIKDRRAVNIPKVEFSMNFLSEKDIKDIEYAISKDVDFIALSFVSKKEDILVVREILEKHNSKIDLISKIENESALDNIDDILRVSDGIMVARGDLGVEISFDRLPIIQKQLVTKAKEAGKICIVATEMLASMETSLRPTRAEVSDVANAIIDCADAVMLSGETANGLYPVNTVKVMSDICVSTEHDLEMKKFVAKNLGITEAIAYSVYESSLRLKTKVVVAATNSGYTARLVSKYRPKCPILAPTPNSKTATMLSLNYGIIPIVVDKHETTDKIIEESVDLAIKYGQLEKDDVVIITGGFPMLKSKHTNFMKIEKI